MTIDLRQLRFAVTAADKASFLRAAKHLHVKQSTLSKKVSALEHRLGITLFDRSTRGVLPTETGKAFLEVARRIVRDVDNLKATATVECVFIQPLFLHPDLSAVVDRASEEDSGG